MIDMADRLEYLLRRYITDQIDEKEYAEFWERLREESQKESFSGEFQQLWEYARKKKPIVAPEAWNRKIQEHIDRAEDGRTPVKKNRMFPKLGWAAAVVLLAAGAYLFYTRTFRSPAEVVVAGQVRDLPPGGSKAVLTLADGSTVVLDSTHSTAISRQGSAEIHQAGAGRIAYEAHGSDPDAVVYNTLQTPRGGDYQIDLADGTKVWLNAASSLRFPTSFSGPSRDVRITGEAYFEVAPDARAPFIVHIDNMKIKVLGTSFNVNAYDNEAFVRTTLLTGAVSVQQGATITRLVPGDQARVDKQGKIEVLKNAALEETVAWKNNLFWFDNNTIEEVMRQLARWYNVNVRINGDIHEHFTGSLPRDVKVSQVFQILQETSNVHFEIKDNTIIASPSKNDTK